MRYLIIICILNTVFTSSVLTAYAQEQIPCDDRAADTTIDQFLSFDAVATSIAALSRGDTYSDDYQREFIVGLSEEAGFGPNGERLTSHDIVETIRSFLDPQRPKYGGELAMAENDVLRVVGPSAEVEAVDDYTLKFSFDSTQPGFLSPQSTLALADRRNELAGLCAFARSSAKRGCPKCPPSGACPQSIVEARNTCCPKSGACEQ